MGAFAAVLLAMVLWEVLAPRRVLAHPRSRRWPANLGIVVLNTLLLRLALPVAAVGLAAVAADRGWGLLNQVDVPGWLAFIVAVVALDLLIYLQHVLFHAVPALWRLHRMHHADLDFDVTTGARFHPVEVMVSAGIKLGAVAVLGPSAAAVLVFEVLLNATAMFNHGNVRVPAPVERWLRWLVVTPDMHRVHHSVLPRETNRNFGFALPWWDRLFGTYLAQPAAGHEGMSIGLGQFRDPVELRLHRMLLQPLRGDGGAYPLGAGNVWRLVSLAVLGGAVGIALLQREAVDVDHLRAFLTGIDPTTAALVFTLAYALATVLFLPGAVFGLAGGALFGPLWGTVFNLCGALLGAGAAFLISRHVAGQWVARRLGGRFGELVRGIEAEGWRFVAFVRLVPLFPFNLLNYALGLTRIRFSHYLLASAMAMLPGVVLYTWIGHAGREAIAGGENAPRLIMAGIALFAAIAFLPHLIRRLHRP
jgi:sterol desaturase/sphingolipid hydroxylase (fatty acid hydroxylase superfamily)/uncharacterized membrane protein YdjX (TVP38/TMEM64 family)